MLFKDFKYQFKKSKAPTLQHCSLYTGHNCTIVHIAVIYPVILFIFFILSIILSTFSPSIVVCIGASCFSRLSYHPPPLFGSVRRRAAILQSILYSIQAQIRVLSFHSLLLLLVTFLEDSTYTTWCGGDSFLPIIRDGKLLKPKHCAKALGINAFKNWREKMYT